MTTPTPTLSNFEIAPRVYGSAPFELPNPISPSNGLFTFTSSDTEVATISGRLVTILKAGNTNITATQAATSAYTTASITVPFSVNVITPTLSNFNIPQKLFSDVSFVLTNPTSNSPGSFSFRSLSSTIASVAGNIVTIKRVGQAQIEAIQNPAPNYGSATIITSFDIVTSVVRIGVQNKIDLSWNRPINNGGTIKNYFFYVEERVSSITPAPPINTILTTNPVASSYYSYALPQPYSSDILSSGGLPTGVDINKPIATFNINTSPTFTKANQFDLGYYGEVEVSWVYHDDQPIQDLTQVATTLMTITLYKNSGNTGENRVYLLENFVRLYDSAVNGLGPRPQNNDKIMTDIFTIDFDTRVDRSLKYLKQTDVISGDVRFSSLSYSSNRSDTEPYSIIIKSIRIVPYRFALTRDFTSIGFGRGDATTGVGFTVSTVNATAPRASSGILYHMPKMTRSLTDFNDAKWTFSWNYGANITKLATDISFLPIPISSGKTVADISNINIPFQLRIRGYSRPYSGSSSILIEQYNTTDVTTFLANIGNTALYPTKTLFDISVNRDASYSEIISGSPKSVTFDISGATGFPLFSETFDTSHTQMVFLFQLSITDPSYNAYFQTISEVNNAFRVNMLSQTFTPRQEYRFDGPDPTLASSNSLTSLTKTTYNITDPYTDIVPYYKFYNLTNGVFYSYKIASNNRAGTSSFSELFTRRCGSVPNQIVNRIENNQNTLQVEAERTSNQVIIYWEKPGFSGYEIQYFVIQMTLDLSGRWLTFLEYTKDLPHNQITFGDFEDFIIPVTNQSLISYSRIINTFRNKLTGVGGSLINGSKYYFRLASVNELGYSLYSTILSGIVFARPSSAPITFIGKPLVGDKLVYITWKIPQDDAGSPILTYIIDYEEENSGKVIQYKENALVPSANDLKNMFFTVYTKYKNYDTLSDTEKTNLDISRNDLMKYVIPPTPITLSDPDNIVNTNNPNFNNDPNKTVKLSYDQKTFSYISDELTQNVFDVANIQLKWYYFTDNLWPDDLTTVSFKMSIRGHLIDANGNGERDISNIFYIPPGNVPGGVDRYTVNPTIFSTNSVVKFIDYKTGSVIVNNQISKILIPTLPRIDSYNNQRYKLQIDYEITEFFPNTGDYRFFLYSGPIIINGSAPVRTYPGLNLNTIFTYKIQNVPGVSPIENNKTYNFRFTPFNLNEFFSDVNTISSVIGTSFAAPITNMSYSLVSTSLGGVVVLQWRYAEISDYNINILIQDDFQNGDQEYESQSLATGSRSIFARNLVPNKINNIVTYSIPSTDPTDVVAQYAQKYLRSGRAYSITVQAVKIVLDAVGNEFPLSSSVSSITPTNTYIVPFRTPLRPLNVSSLGYNGSIVLKWKLPNLESDPNYYATTASDTDPPMPFYRYKFYSLDVRSINGNVISEWSSVAPEIEIPSTNVPGSETTYTVSSLTNELDYQFRVRLMIINSYNTQRAFSDYSYISNINSVSVTESSENMVYPSIYPYKPSVPRLNPVNRAESIPGSFNVLVVSFDFPSYTGNAERYECFIEYTQPIGVTGSGTVWKNIFDSDILYRIANTSDNNSVLENNRLYTSLLSGSGSTGTQTFRIICKETIKKYGIRIRVIGRKGGLGEPYPKTESLYSDYSFVDYIDY